MGGRRGHNATAGLRSLPLIAILLLSFLHNAAAYQYVDGSPCANQCNEGTLINDAVCLDAQYADTSNGTRLEGCVGCLLNSTAVDEANNQTDVEWGLCKKIHHSDIAPG
jgi:hypothetical protein